MAINWENKTPLKILKIFGYDHEKNYPNLDARNNARLKAIERIEKYRKGIPDSVKNQILSFSDEELKRIEREKENERRRRERLRLKRQTILSNIENDTYGDDNYAIALYQHLIELGEIQGDEIEELKDKKEELENTLKALEPKRDKVKSELEDLEQRLSQVDNDAVYDRISQRIEQLQELNDTYDEEYEEIDSELDDTVSELNDISINGVLYELNYGWYGDYTRLFETDFGDYAIIEEKYVDDAFKEYITQLIDDVGVESINEWVRESCVDTDSIKELLEQDRIDMYREDYNYDEAQFLEDYIDEFPHDSQEKIQEYIDNHQFEDYDIDDFVNDNEVDDVIRDLSEQYANEMATDFVELKAMGFDLNDYTNIDCLVEEVMRVDDYGTMSSYDGSYEIQNVNDDTFYIFRVN